MDEQKLVSNLERKGFHVVCFDTAAEAVAYMTSAVSGKTIGIGGSMTVQEIGLDKALGQHNTVYWHWTPDMVPQCSSSAALRDLAAGAEVYISSANAIAETGEIVNIDGTGNRIASLAYGHKQVFFIVGENKVTETLDTALWRARNVAAPKNAQRLCRNTPCAQKADRCYDCSSPERICKGFLILTNPMTGVEMTVVLVRKPLGA